MGLSAHPSSWMSCLSFSTTFLLLGVNYPGPGLPRSKCPLKVLPHSGIPHTDLHCSFPLTSPVLKLEDPRSGGLHWAQEHWNSPPPRVSGCPWVLRGHGWYSLQVAAQLLLAAAGPVEAMEGCLNQGCHDTAQPYLVATAVALAIVFHT